jgi:hypothetical protein
MDIKYYYYDEAINNNNDKLFSTFIQYKKLFGSIIEREVYNNINNEDNLVDRLTNCCPLVCLLFNNDADECYFKLRHNNQGYSSYDKTKFDSFIQENKYTNIDGKNINYDKKYNIKYFEQLKYEKYLNNDINFNLHNYLSYEEILLSSFIIRSFIIEIPTIASSATATASSSATTATSTSSSLININSYTFNYNYQKMLFKYYKLYYNNMCNTMKIYFDTKAYIILDTDNKINNTILNIKTFLLYLITPITYSYKTIINVIDYSTNSINDLKEKYFTYITSSNISDYNSVFRNNNIYLNFNNDTINTNEIEKFIFNTNLNSLLFYDYHLYKDLNNIQLYDILKNKFILENFNKVFNKNIILTNINVA